ncbi:HupE/UreJ family protein [Akkermansiaceae bacterium]|nr:HupE/UreJ family protein [Akkermansiaceae bacterium]
MPRIPIAMLILASAGAVAPAYFALGFTHIIPHGPDHILFILALFFLTRKPADLLFQLTLFTLAHSLTLGLSLYGFIGLPEAFVETAIALSIVFVAGENLCRESLSPWRPWVVFASGLVHGLGFANHFPAIPRSAGDFLPAMFGFNLGIEFGQIAVVGIAYAAVAAWWKHASYRNRIARPASAIIALSGLYWAAVAF